MTQHESYVDMDVLCWSCVWEIKRACFIQSNVLCNGIGFKVMILIVMPTLHGTALGPIFSVVLSDSPIIAVPFTAAQCA